MQQQNKAAWERSPESAWHERFGSPESYAERIKKDPRALLKPIDPFFNEVKGKKILNLMGSNGNKAVALSLLGASVTVVDFSESNRNYAIPLAEAAGVNIEYIVSDVLSAKLSCDYDLVFAEMGILHYFEDLIPFFTVMKDALRPGGRALIRDFHPVSTKLISSRGSTAKVRKHKVDGDYFDKRLIEKNVAYGKFLEEGEGEKVYLRLWTLGEIITAAADTGLRVVSLEEAPNLSSDVFDRGIPKTFVLILER